MRGLLKKVLLCLFFFKLSLFAVETTPYSETDPSCAVMCPSCLVWQSERDYCFYVGIETGYRKFFMPSFADGFLFPLASLLAEDFTSFTPFSIDDDHPSSAYVLGFAGFRLPECFCPCWLGKNFRAEISGDFFSDHLIHNQIQVLPPSTGVVFGFIDGANSVSTAASSVDGIFSRSYYYNGGAIDLKTTYCCTPCCLIEPVVTFAVHELQQKYHYTADITTLTGAIDSVITEERLKTDYYDFGGGLHLECGLPCCMSFFLGGEILGSYAHTWLKGKQDIAFITTHNHVTRSDKKHVLSSKYLANAGLKFNFQRLSVALLGRYEYWSYTPKILNPQIDSLITLLPVNPALIKNTHSYNYSVGIRIAAPF